MVFREVDDLFFLFKKWIEIVKHVQIWRKKAYPLHFAPVNVNVFIATAQLHQYTHAEWVKQDSESILVV